MPRLRPHVGAASTAWDYRVTNWWEALPDDSLDVVYDTVGSAGDAERAMRKLRRGGIFVTIAGATAAVPKPGVRQASIHNWAKNASTVTTLAGFVERGALRPIKARWYPLSAVAEAFNESKAGGVVGKLGVAVAS